MSAVPECIVREVPAYLMDMIQEKDMHWEGLRSIRDHKSLVVPWTRRHTFASRSFSVVGPTLWNSLPNTIKQSNNLEVFKTKLKIHLFRCAFN